MESSHFISTNCSQCESTSSKEANCMSLTVYFALGVAMSLLICICIKVNSAQLCCITNGRSRSRHLRTLIAAAHSCQCERPFNQWSCLCRTLAVWTFSLIITFKSRCVLSLACSVDRGMYLLSLSFKMTKPCSSVQTYMSSCLSISFFSSFFFTFAHIHTPYLFPPHSPCRWNWYSAFSPHSVWD